MGNRVLRRFYTVMIVPHEGGALRRLSVSLNFVLSMAAVFLFCFVCSAFLSHFFLDGLHRPEPAATARLEAERLAVENARLRSELQGTVLRVEDLISRLEEYAQLQDDWTPPLDAMGGLSDFGSFDASTGSDLGALSDLAAGRRGAGAPMPTDGGSDLDRAAGLDAVGLDGDWSAVARAVQERADFWKRSLEEQICDRSAYLRTLPSVWPVRGRVTSGYSWRRDPLNGHRQFHAGLDIAAPHGTQVACPADGTVVDAGREGGYGNVVRVNHGNGIQTVYAHLRRYFVRPGQSLARGAVLGEVGSTGRSTGPHLHYEVTKDGRQVDPTSFLD